MPDLPLADFLEIDLPAALSGVFAALACGLLGNFLVLRRQSLIGDAMSHVVLPGIVIGFLVAGTIESVPMMLGALAAALVAVGLIELIRALSGLEPGAAMGVVFTTMFALGVLILEQTGTAGVHLDVEHALYGNLEGILWLGATDWGELFTWQHLAEAPRQLMTLTIVAILVVLVVWCCFKELKLVSFDPGLAASLGLSPRLVGFALTAAVAAAAVAAFEAVGSIMVIAMFICPAATARLLTDDLATQLWLSALVAVVSGLLGYWLAAFGPFLVGGEASLNAAGMIAVVAGLLQGLAILFAPRYGVLARRVYRRRTARALAERG